MGSQEQIRTPRINVHAHIFTADHTPEIQFYYIIRDLIASAISLDRLDAMHKHWAGRVLLALVPVAGRVFPGKIRQILRGFTALAETVSRATGDDLKEIFGARGSRLRAGHVIRFYRRGVRDWKKLPDEKEDSPLNFVLKRFVGEFYKRHRKNSAGAAGPITQRQVLDLYEGSLRGKTDISTMVVLSMDFDRAFAHVYEPRLATAPDVLFPRQCNELLQLRGNAPSPALIPFVCIDPRSYDVIDGNTRRKMWDVVHEYVDQGFYGVKLYPPLGYLPEDPRLEGVFDYCLEHQLPVLVHGGTSGAGRKGAVNCGDLAHPYYWIPVLDRLAQRYKSEGHGQDWKFRLCLGHFGGAGPLKKEAKSWWDEVLKLMDLYGNETGIEIYTDVSFNITEKTRKARRYFTHIRKEFCDNDNRRSRILFGCDWWMYLYEMEALTYYRHAFERWKGRRFYPKLTGRQTMQELLDENAHQFLGPRCAGMFT